MTAIRIEWLTSAPPQSPTEQVGAEPPLSEQVQAMGEEARYMRILAFCDALIAKKMVEYNIIFAGFLPCRIAVIEDAEGQGWLVTMNMDMMLHAVDLPPELKPMAEQVRDETLADDWSRFEDREEDPVSKKLFGSDLNVEIVATFRQYHASAHYNRALLFQRLGDSKAARMDAEKAAKIAPGPEAYQRYLEELNAVDVPPAEPTDQG